MLQCLVAQFLAQKSHLYEIAVLWRVFQITPYGDYLHAAGNVCDLLHTKWLPCRVHLTLYAQLAATLCSKPFGCSRLPCRFFALLEKYPCRYLAAPVHEHMNGLLHGAVPSEMPLQGGLHLMDAFSTPQQMGLHL